jgi:hypothetical protein
VDEGGGGAGAEEDRSREERRAPAESFPVPQESVLREEYVGKPPTGFQ